MSKSITRVVISVLITIVLVAGVYTSVLGATLNAGTKSAQVYMGAGVKLGMLHNRSSVQSLDGSGAQAETYNQPGHDCHPDSIINPEDY